jgi:hypothetical protein
MLWAQQNLNLNIVNYALILNLMPFIIQQNISLILLYSYTHHLFSTNPALNLIQYFLPRNQQLVSFIRFFTSVTKASFVNLMGDDSIKVLSIVP